jgi:hypothetical protein
MKRSLVTGCALGSGMLAFSAFAFGAFQRFFYFATVSWVIALFIGGVILRRCLFHSLRKCFLVYLTALFVFTIILFIISLLFGEASEGFVALAEAILLMTGSVYLPFFWLPLASGLLAGQLRLSKQHHDT